MKLGKFLIACALAFASVGPAQALETQVSTGVYYFSSDPVKTLLAETEHAEDGLEFRAARDPRDVARDNAEAELRKGNVCLRQLSRDLKASLRQWKVRAVCEKMFAGELDQAVRDAAKANLHPDHVECAANAEAREHDGTIAISLSFRAQLVMRDRAPAKLRRAGIGGELTRWDLAPQEDRLGEAAESWKAALKEGACAADARALDKFWDRFQKREADARELARCREEQGREFGTIARLQKQLRDYVPEEWVTESAGDDAGKLFAEPVAAPEGAGLKQCKDANANAGRELERLREVSAKIAGRHDVPALDPDRTAGARAPASVDAEDEE